MIRKFEWAKIDLINTLQEFFPAKSVCSGQPEFVIIAGPSAVGKTLYRRQKYSSDFVTIDAGDIFLSLTCNRRLKFPTEALNFEINYIGYNLLNLAVTEKRNSVCELSLIPYEEYELYVEMIKKLGFSVNIEWLNCDFEITLERNATRGNEFISSYYTDAYHLDWIDQIYSSRLG